MNRFREVITPKVRHQVRAELYNLAVYSLSQLTI